MALDALSGNSAWLAVTATRRTQSSSPLMTVVFGTSDGGWTWTESAPFKVPAPAGPLSSLAAPFSFADPDDGWLLVSYGGTPVLADG